MDVNYTTLKGIKKYIFKNRPSNFLTFLPESDFGVNSEIHLR